MSPTPQLTGRVRVWDVPVRLVHWLIVVLVAACWWTAEKGQMDWHRWAGYGALGLVLFRIWWGFVGGESARFASFLRGPKEVLAYAGKLFGRDHRVSFGHNPMGGWSVLLLIGLLLSVSTLGLFTVDIDGIESGPLSHLVSFDQGRLAAQWHHWLFNGLLAVIALHLLAVFFYLAVRRENLVGAMIGGYKRGEGGPLRFASPWLAVVGAVLAAAATWVLAGGLKGFGLG